MPTAQHLVGVPARGGRLVLAGVLLSTVLGGAALSWWCLPRWAPRLVIRHSPWLGPVLRAAARSDPVAREEAAARFAGWGAQAVPGLIDGLDDGDAAVRAVAATGLGRLRDRGAVAALLRALDDPDDATVMAAADALGRIGDPAAVDGLLALLQSDEDLVRDCALLSLGGLPLTTDQRRVVEAYQRSIR